MNFPKLVLKQFCKTPVKVTVYGEGITEDGAPEILLNADLLCNYQDCAKTVLTAQQKKVEVSGVIFIPDDFIPDSPTISGGYVEIFGVRREIAKGRKARNPDGSVNYIELEVI